MICRLLHWHILTTVTFVCCLYTNGRIPYTTSIVTFTTILQVVNEEHSLCVPKKISCLSDSAPVSTLLQCLVVRSQKCIQGSTFHQSLWMEKSPFGLCWGNSKLRFEWSSRCCSRSKVNEDTRFNPTRSYFIFKLLGFGTQKARSMEGLGKIMFASHINWARLANVIFILKWLTHTCCWQVAALSEAKPNETCCSEGS